MQESPHKESNINLYENKEYNNPNNTNEVDNQNSISTEDNLNKKLNIKHENKYQKFKTNFLNMLVKLLFGKNLKIKITKIIKKMKLKNKKN